MNTLLVVLSAIVVLAFFGAVLTAMVRSIGVLGTLAVWASSALFTAAVYCLASWGGAA